MQQWLDDFVAKLNGLLANDFPEAEPSKVTAVSIGIAGIYFNVESMKGIGNIDNLVASSKQAAFILLHSLNKH
jgi:hypothetical protein